MIVDCAYYADGVRQDTGPLGIAEAAELVKGGEGFVWLGMLEPTQEMLLEAQQAFDLHELAVEDAYRPHQRPKLEDYINSWFAVLRTARYNDETEAVEFGEVHLFLGPGYAIAVRHGDASELTRARQRLESRPDLAKLGPVAAAWAIIDRVVDDYAPVVDGIDNDISEVEEQVFSLEGDPTQRIYFLKREVIEFHRAVVPLLGPLESLERGTLVDVDDTLQRFFRDVSDHATRVADQLHGHRELLTSVLEANLALVSVKQNEVVRKISAWAAIIAVPTFVASVYGMNFANMPELDLEYGYPIALLGMLAMVGLLYRNFKRAGWI